MPSTPDPDLVAEVVEYSLASSADPEIPWDGLITQATEELIGRGAFAVALALMIRSGAPDGKAYELVSAVAQRSGRPEGELFEETYSALLAD